VSTVSTSTRTPISIEVVCAWLTIACTVTRSPMKTGDRKLMSSMAAVTTRRRACLMAAMPAAVSTSRMIVPPWT
jgi:hypothetical protein